MLRKLIMGKGQGTPPPMTTSPVPGIQRTPLVMPQQPMMQYHILAVACELEVLPEEILKKIFQSLPVTDVVALARVCELWRHLLSEPEHWVFMLQRDFPSIYKYPDALRSLSPEAQRDPRRKYRELWLSMNPPQPWKVFVPRLNEHIQDLSQLYAGLQSSIMGITQRQAHFRAREYGSNRSIHFASMFDEKEQEFPAFVRRGGRVFYRQMAHLLVPGDVVELRAGLIVPADLRLLFVSGLVTDRSMFFAGAKRFYHTLESTEKEYEENGRIALYGSKVVTGTALGIVLCIGGNTWFGRVTTRLLSDKRKTLAAGRSPTPTGSPSSSPSGSRAGTPSRESVIVRSSPARSGDRPPAIRNAAVLPLLNASPMGVQLLGKFLPSMSRMSAIVSDIDDLLTIDTQAAIGIYVDGTYYAIGTGDSNIGYLKEKSFDRLAPAIGSTAIFTSPWIQVPLADDADPLDAIAAAPLKALTALALKTPQIYDRLKACTKRLGFKAWDPSDELTAVLVQGATPQSKGFDLFVAGLPERVLPLCSKAANEKDGTVWDLSEKMRTAEELRSRSGNSNWRSNVIAFAEVQFAEGEVSPSDTKPTLIYSTFEKKRLSFLGYVVLDRAVSSKGTALLNRLKETESKLLLTFNCSVERAKRIAIQCGMVSIVEATNDAEIPSSVAKDRTVICSFVPRDLRTAFQYTDKLFIFKPTPDQRELIVQVLQESGETVCTFGGGLLESFSAAKADVPFAPATASQIMKQFSIVLNDNTSDGLLHIFDAIKVDTVGKCSLQ